MRSPLVGALALLLLAPACEGAGEIALEVAPGREADALSQEPAVADVEIVVLLPDESVAARANAAPGGEFDLGEFPETEILRFEITGKTSEGEVVARGRSVSIAIGALSATTLPLFIQRLGEFARPPDGLVRAHVRAPGGVLGERYLIATGGDAAIGEDGAVDPAIGDFYDLLGLAANESGGPLPRAARSMVVRGSGLLLIDDDGASLADLDAGTTSDLEGPSGFAFADVSGGISLEGEDGQTYVVGPTRDDEASDSVLVVTSSGELRAVRLATARSGAAAVYVPGVGLVIAGGAAEGAGVEVVHTDGATVSTIPFPSDATTGAAAVVTNEQQITLFGGRLAGMPASTRVLDLRCVSDCEGDVQVLDELPVEDLAARGQAYNIPSGVLVVGEAEPEEDGPGETLAFRVDLAAETVTPLPFKERRRGATPIPAPNGTLAIMGGLTPTGSAARSVELYFPE
ncbi:MAG: hypothetical protein IPG04_05815 [Polyangiaceae bacterium]|jgi:hypothetical protein|nr:hypothetical protein [Polyangiaceae bacterium]